MKRIIYLLVLIVLFVSDCKKKDEDPAPAPVNSTTVAPVPTNTNTPSPDFNLKVFEESELIIAPYFEFNVLLDSGEASRYDVSIEGMGMFSVPYAGFLTRLTKNIGLNWTQGQQVKVKIEAFDNKGKMVGRITEKKFSIFYDHVEAKEIPNHDNNTPVLIADINSKNDSDVYINTTYNYFPNYESLKLYFDIDWPNTIDNKLEFALYLPDGLVAGGWPMTTKEKFNQNSDKACMVTVDTYYDNGPFAGKYFRFSSLESTSLMSVQVYKIDINDPTKNVFRINISKNGVPGFMIIHAIAAK